MAAAPLRTPRERAPIPELGTDPIPKERYTSREFAEREWDKMWTRVWLMAGRTSDIPEPGDYLTFEIGRESILVIRQPDGRLAARYNVCMHRGNRLREPGRGHAESFSCLFHGWRYGIDGQLIEALDPHCFPQGLPTPQLDLQPVRVDTWAGFVFVNLNPGAEPLADYLGMIPTHLDPYHFEEWKVSFDATIEIECNWKRVFTHRPHPDDPNKMLFDFIELVRTPAQEVPRPEKQHYSTANGDTLAGKCGGGELLDEDLYNLPRIQAGMRSSAFKGLHLNTQEIRIRHHHHNLLQYLES